MPLAANGGEFEMGDGSRFCYVVALREADCLPGSPLLVNLRSQSGSAGIGSWSEITFRKKRRSWCLYATPRGTDDELHRRLCRTLAEGQTLSKPEGRPQCRKCSALYIRALGPSR